MLFVHCDRHCLRNHEAMAHERERSFLPYARTPYYAVVFRFHPVLVFLLHPARLKAITGSC